MQTTPSPVLAKGTAFVKEFVVSQDVYERFIALFNDRNPYHVSDQAARAKGFAGKIMHGNILSGLWKGFRDLYELGFTDRLPKLIGVQAEGAMPLVTAFNSKAPVMAVSTNTFADSIAVGQPRDASAVLKALRDSNGHAVAVSDELISSAQSVLAKRGAVFAEPARTNGAEQQASRGITGGVAKPENSGCGAGD